MIYVTHIPKKERMRALRDIYALELGSAEVQPMVGLPDRLSTNKTIRPVSIMKELRLMVLDPIVDGFHLTRVLMDGGSSLNLIYADTVRKMGIDPSRIKPSNTTLRGYHTRS